MCIRDRSVTAAAVAKLAERYGLSCFGQELFPWGGSQRLSECITVVTPKGSKWARDTVIVQNPHFIADAFRAAQISNCLGEQRIRHETRP